MDSQLPVAGTNFNRLPMALLIRGESECCIELGFNNRFTTRASAYVLDMNVVGVIKSKSFGDFFACFRAHPALAQRQLCLISDNASEIITSARGMGFID
jgi:hypothetical protein